MTDRKGEVEVMFITSLKNEENGLAGVRNPYKKLNHTYVV